MSSLSENLTISPLDLELPAPLMHRVTTWDDEDRYDVVVVGAGIAGLAFTLRLPENARVAMVTKGALGESNTRYAQGGLAAAIGADDSPDLHFADTMAAGAGLCDPAAVRALVERGPEAVRWLLAQGTRFDPGESESLALGREAAHARNRVLHAGGDATGAEIERSLVARLRSRPRVDVREQSTALDLLVADGRCGGVLVRHIASERVSALRAPVAVLANGGAGQLWAVTSNPPAATGDGIAMAMRAGVTVADLEFTQFHPTVLALPEAPPFLISEAVRGEGAYLRNRRGERFMVAEHPMAELAPRDIVARAIQREIAASREPSVWLDLRHLDAAAMAARFPTIAAHLERHGLDLASDLLPVAPAAHYFMGGIVAGTAGETSLPGLLAIGEVSCTGVHGANRLASNSLLEGLVFGLNAADHLAADRALDLAEVSQRPSNAARTPSSEDAAAMRQELRTTMSQDVVVVRHATGLDRAAKRIGSVAARLGDVDTGRPELTELRSMALLALAIIAAARRREESRGCHFRADFPEAAPELVGQHQLLVSSTTVPRLVYGPLAGARNLDSLRAPT